MKKALLSISIVLLLALVCVIGFLSIGRAGGEIGFGAIVDKVEDGIACATVTEQDAGFLSQKLPDKILFSTAELDVELKAGDIISACYLRGTIDGQTRSGRERLCDQRAEIGQKCRSMNCLRNFC